MNRNILVLGGLGFVGRHLCHLLSHEGITVYSLGHGTIPNQEINDWGIKHWVNSSITLEALTEAFKHIKFSAVIHCAGSGAVSLSYQQPFDDYQRSVISVMAGLEFVRITQSQQTRFVLASSAAVYGNQSTPLSENSGLTPVSPYGLHKVAAENLCREYSQFFNVNCSVVRLFSVYGASLRKQLLWDACNKFKNGNAEFFGSGEELRDWIHVRDASSLLQKSALTEGQESLEIYNGGGFHASTREVLSQLANSLGISVDLQFNGKIHEGNPKNLIADSSRASDKLDWLPQISIEQGMMDYAKWIKSDL